MINHQSPENSAELIAAHLAESAEDAVIDRAETIAHRRQYKDFKLQKYAGESGVMRLDGVAIGYQMGLMAALAILQGQEPKKPF